MVTPATEGAPVCAAAGKRTKRASSGAASASLPGARRSAAARGVEVAGTEAACILPSPSEVSCTMEEPVRRPGKSGGRRRRSPFDHDDAKYWIRPCFIRTMPGIGFVHVRSKRCQVSHPPRIVPGSSRPDLVQSVDDVRERGVGSGAIGIGPPSMKPSTRRRCVSRTGGRFRRRRAGCRIPL